MNDSPSLGNIWDDLKSSEKSGKIRIISDNTGRFRKFREGLKRFGNFVKIPKIKRDLKSFGKISKSSGNFT